MCDCVCMIVPFLSGVDDSYRDDLECCVKGAFVNQIMCVCVRARTCV